MSNNVLEDLYQVVLDRKAQYASSGESADEIKKKSYTCYLFSQGENKILKKCGEECTEMVIAAKNHDNNELKNEISDLLIQSHFPLLANMMYRSTISALQKAM